MEIPSKQLAAMYEILDREAGDSPFSDSQRRWFRRLDRFGYGWLILSSVIGIPYGIDLILRDGSDFSHIMRLFVMMTLWFSPCSITTYFLMFSLNWKQIFTTLKREKEVWKLGYGDMLVAPWRAERANHRIINALTLVAGPFLWAWGLLFIVVELFSDVLIPEPIWPHPQWWVYLCATYVIGMGTLYLLLHFFRRADERLAVINRLRESLGSAAGAEISASDGNIAVPLSAKICDIIAQIERKQIWEQRAASISNFDADSDIAFVVQKSRAVRAAESGLDPVTNLRVQDEIVSLAQGLPESDIVGSGGGGVCWRPVANTHLQIGYSADRSARRIRILELRSANNQNRPVVDSP